MRILRELKVHNHTKKIYQLNTRLDLEKALIFACYPETTTECKMILPKKFYDVDEAFFQVMGYDERVEVDDIAAKTKGKLWVEYKIEGTHGRL